MARSQTRTPPPATKLEVVWRSEDDQSYQLRADCVDWFRTIPDNSVDCVWTDPPYMLSNDGITCVAGRMVKVNKGEWDRSRGVDADHEFNRAWLAECFRVLKPSGTIWVSGTLHVYLSVGMAMHQIGFRILNDIIWEKPAPPPNLGCRCFTHATEVLLWATKAKKGSKDRHVFNYADMRAENAGKQMKNVWRFHTPSKDEKTHGKHPTQKPLALIDRCLRASTHPDDLVLDPFAGSGSTGVVAIALGRRYIGCEREAEYARLAAQRLADVRPSSSLRSRRTVGGTQRHRQGQATLFEEHV
jgi:site-specific DNA-methyltransferase (adenine-specific)